MKTKLNELVWAALFAAATALGQSDVTQLRVPPPGDPAAPKNVFYVTADDQVGGTVSAHASTFEYVRSDVGGPSVVKGAPYTAEAVTENTQTLPDGNRIVHNDRTTLARDSEGRTRRDMTMPLLPGMTASETPRFSFIHDPSTNT